MFEDFAAPKGADGHQLWLRNGEPILFGSEKSGGTKRIALDADALTHGQSKKVIRILVELTTGFIRTSIGFSR
jgi:hypothetical protein